MRLRENNTSAPKRQTSEHDWKKNIKRKKSNSRDKFITFSGCDTELKHLNDINGEHSNIAGANFGPNSKISPNVAAFSNWFIIKNAVNELFE